MQGQSCGRSPGRRHCGSDVGAVIRRLSARTTSSEGDDGGPTGTGTAENQAEPAQLNTANSKEAVAGCMIFVPGAQRIVTQEYNTGAMALHKLQKELKRHFFDW